MNTFTKSLSVPFRHPLGLGLMLLGLMLLVPGCQDNLKVAEGEAKREIKINQEGPQPKVVIEKPVHDFGTMEVGQTLRHDFVIRNDGEGELVLVKDRSTCKCTMADFEEREVPPGESTIITLEWVGKVQDDKFSQAAYIKTNDAENKEISLTVTGIVDATFEILPVGVWNLGELKFDESTPFSGTITSTILDQFEVVDVSSVHPLVKVSCEKMSPEKLAQEELKSGYDIRGEISSGIPIGQFEASINLKLKYRETEEQDLTFQINGYRAGSIQVIGPAGWQAREMKMNLGRIRRDEGREVQLSMFLRDNMNGPLEIKEIKADPDILSFSMTRDENFTAENRERYVIKLGVPPNAASVALGEANPGIIEVTTNHPELSKIIFKVQVLTY
ncbi:MAG: DUF1573 domain-containing protein [Planctomycetaceae bacterium]|nr:DUF1573 domain-containing protein [Planctomycetaceae bacterium]